MTPREVNRAACAMIRAYIDLVDTLRKGWRASIAVVLRVQGISDEDQTAVLNLVDQALSREAPLSEIDAETFAEQMRITKD